MSTLEKSLALLGLPSEGEGGSIGEAAKAYRWGKEIRDNLIADTSRKKVMSYANSASGSGKLVEISAAFVEVWFGLRIYRYFNY